MPSPDAPRIAMLSVHTCPLAALGGKETGGMNVYVRELSRELGRRGFYVDAFTRSQNPEIPHIPDADLGPTVRVIHVRCGPESPYPKEMIWDYLPEFVEGVRCHIHDEGIRYDIYHSHYWLSGWVAHALQSLYPAPIVHMFHTLGRMKDLVARRPEESEVGHRNYVEGQVLRWADRIVAATPRDKEQMVKLYGAAPDPIVVIPPGVDTELFKPMDKAEARAALGIPVDQELVLFVGRIEPLKGIDTLIEAMALAFKDNTDLESHTRLAIIGGDVSDDPAMMTAEMNRLHDLRASLGIENLVTFLGKQDQTSLPLYYNAAEALVVPSHYESFGMVAVEALACGTPVIASDVGGLSYIVEDGVTGFLVPDQQPAILADRLRFLLQVEPLRRAFGRRAAAAAQQYAWSHVADRIIEQYEQLGMRVR
ncbi:MAG: glycosyltransferase [Anaerolineae bacterium]|nr:glycosyltransferase [Anaerolineae bacterium]